MTARNADRNSARDKNTKPLISKAQKTILPKPISSASPHSIKCNPLLSFYEVSCLERAPQNPKPPSHIPPYPPPPLPRQPLPSYTYPPLLSSPLPFLLPIFLIHTYIHT